MNDDSYNWEEDAIGSYHDVIAEIKSRVERGEAMPPLYEELFKPPRRE